MLNYYHLYVLYTCSLLTFTEINYMSSGYGLTPFHLIHNSCSSHPKFTEKSKSGRNRNTPILLRAYSHNVNIGMKYVTYWYQFFTRCEKLVLIFYGVKLAKFEICGSTVLPSIDHLLVFSYFHFLPHNFALKYTIKEGYKYAIIKWVSP